MLKGFKRVTLQPGEQQAVSFSLPVAHCAFYDAEMRYVVEPGQVDVMIGGSSAELPLCESFEIVGETTVVEQVFSTPVEVIHS
jgi:beta-glucosidase